MENFEELLATPAFDSLDAEMVELLKECIEQLRGKNVGEAMVVLTDFGKKIPKGKTLSPEQKNVMVEAVLETMPEAERNRYKTILKMMKIV